MLSSVELSADARNVSNTDLAIIHTISCNVFSMGLFCNKLAAFCILMRWFIIDIPRLPNAESIADASIIRKDKFDVGGRRCMLPHALAIAGYRSISIRVQECQRSW